MNYTPDRADFSQLRKIAELMDRLHILPEKTKLPDIALAR
jgi:hypothetical protein